MSNKKVIFVVGPTACGKTELAAALAKKLSSVVISADSMQVYRGMHIASAAPDVSEMQGVPHKLIEFLPYGENFSVADYADLARKEINDCLSRGKTPVVAGGTGLYINALTYNIKFLPDKTNSAVRDRLNAEFDSVGGEAMLARLRKIDGAEAEKLNVSDKRRIVRALEIYETSGLTKTMQNDLSRLDPPDFKPVIIGINYKDRQRLYERINARVDKMIEKGLIDEAKTALENGGSGTATQAIGHKEFFGFLRGEETCEAAVERLKQATRRYAKRQLTWFNKDSRINWIFKDVTPDVYGEAVKIIESEDKCDA